MLVSIGRVVFVLLRLSSEQLLVDLVLLDLRRGQGGQEAGQLLQVHGLVLVGHGRQELPDLLGTLLVTKSLLGFNL